jgi:hypothetical protein
MSSSTHEALRRYAAEFGELARDCRKQNIRLGVWIGETSAPGASPTLLEQVFVRLAEQKRVDPFLPQACSTTLKGALAGYGHPHSYRVEPTFIAPDVNSGPLDPLAGPFGRGSAEVGFNAMLNDRLLSWRRFVSLGECVRAALRNDQSEHFGGMPESSPSGFDDTWPARLLRIVAKTPSQFLDGVTPVSFYDVIGRPDNWVSYILHDLDLAERVTLEAGQYEYLGDPKFMAYVRQKVADAPKARLLWIDDVAEFSAMVLERGLESYQKPPDSGDIQYPQPKKKPGRPKSPVSEGIRALAKAAPDKFDSEIARQWNEEHPDNPVRAENVKYARRIPRGRKGKKSS